MYVGSGSAARRSRASPRRVSAMPEVANPVGSCARPSCSQRSVRRCRPTGKTHALAKRASLLCPRAHAPRKCPSDQALIAWGRVGGAAAWPLRRCSTTSMERRCGLSSVDASNSHASRSPCSAEGPSIRNETVSTALTTAPCSLPTIYSLPRRATKRTRPIRTSRWSRIARTHASSPGAPRVGGFSGWTRRSRRGCTRRRGQGMMACGRAGLCSRSLANQNETAGFFGSVRCDSG